MRKGSPTGVGWVPASWASDTRLTATWPSHSPAKASVVVLSRIARDLVRPATPSSGASGCTRVAPANTSRRLPRPSLTSSSCSARSLARSRRLIPICRKRSCPGTAGRVTSAPKSE